MTTLKQQYEEPETAWELFGTLATTTSKRTFLDALKKLSSLGYVIVSTPRHEEFGL